MTEEIGTKEWRGLFEHVTEIVSTQKGIVNTQEEQGKTLERIHRVLIGNGNRNAVVHQIQDLQHEQETAGEDRQRIINKLDEIGTRIEEQDEKIEEQGKTIEAWRNRILGAVALGTGVGFLLGLFGAKLIVALP